ncbi:MAG: 50S ribosomal protein L23 [Patescibacteria group bacterium]
MALFGTTKKSTEKKAATPKVAKAPRAKKEKKEVAVVVTTKAPVTTGPTHVILRPHVTEKSGLLSQSGKYTFQVARDANKQSISLAVQALYKVVPVHVTVLNQPSRNVFVRGRRGVVPGVRKAIVTLKKGETINFV